MNLGKINKILIIRLSSLGDILLTSPLIRSLNNQFPNLKIDFLLREEYKDAVIFNPNLNSVISLNRKDNSLTVISREFLTAKSKNKVVNLSSQNYDLVIDLQNNLRSRKLSKGISKEILRFKKPSIEKFLLVKFKWNLFKEIIPIPVRYANTIPNFNLDEKGLEIFIGKSEQIKIDENIIGFCPGSRHKTKMWKEEYFVELGNMFSNFEKTILLFGGKDDKEICEKISNKIPNSVNLSNDDELLKTAEVMKKCKVVICNDSGLMHLALAVNIPVIAIFGSTVKEFGFAPYKGKSLVLENNSLSCRPCSHIGLAECPQKHFKCMLDITPQFVFQKTSEFIKNI
ncbi:MAG: glycosyltransferase family 9 protein [Ignavibacteriae bacterium]|nr:glycosyltransferase family 9 protein [Ignavibacteriota bacterium]